MEEPNDAAGREESVQEALRRGRWEEELEAETVDDFKERKGEEAAKDRRESEAPPDDDCCPICFGDFTIPCRADCGHWYCGSCILQYWNYSAASRPCKCPMCTCCITKLIPLASLEQQFQEQEVKDVLANVQRYNRLFVGGFFGLVQKVRELPLFTKRMLRDMMDAGANNLYLHEVRLFAMFLSILYTATEFDFIPTGGLGIIRLFDYGAVALVIILRIAGIFRRRRLDRQVRHLAVADLLHE